MQKCDGMFAPIFGKSCPKQISRKLYEEILQKLEESSAEPVPQPEPEVPQPEVPEPEVPQPKVPQPEVPQPEIPEPEPESQSELYGGYSDSEYDSDGSIFSSDDEFIPYTTAVFDDDDQDEDLMDHIRNMRSKKYLKSLNNGQLRDIMKTNNLKITNNGSYLGKDQMIKSIKKFYK